MFGALATDTKKLIECSNKATQCNLLAAPPLEKLSSTVPCPALNESFLTVTESDTDAELDLTYSCSQEDHTSGYEGNFLIR